MSELITNPGHGPGWRSPDPRGPIAPDDPEGLRQPAIVVRYEGFADEAGPPSEPVPDAEPTVEDAEAIDRSSGWLKALTVAATRGLVAVTRGCLLAAYRYPRWALVFVLSVAILGATALTRPSNPAPPASIAGGSPEDPSPSTGSETGTEGSSPAQAETSSEPVAKKEDDPPKGEVKPTGGPARPTVPEEVPAAFVPIASAKESAPSPPPPTGPVLASMLGNSSTEPAPSPAPTTPATAESEAPPAAQTPDTAPAGPGLPLLPVVGSSPTPADPPTGPALPMVDTPGPLPADATGTPPAGSGPPSPAEDVQLTGANRPGLVPPSSPAPPATVPTPAAPLPSGPLMATVLLPRVPIPAAPLPPHEEPATDTTETPTAPPASERPPTPAAPPSAGAGNKVIGPAIAELSGPGPIPGPKATGPAPGPEAPTRPSIADPTPVLPTIAPSPGGTEPKSHADEVPGPAPFEVADLKPGPEKPTTGTPAPLGPAVADPRPADGPSTIPAGNPERPPSPEHREATTSTIREEATPRQTEDPPSVPATPAASDFAGSGWVRISNKGRISLAAAGDPVSPGRREPEAPAGLRGRADAPTRLEAAPPAVTPMDVKEPTPARPAATSRGPATTAPGGAAASPRVEASIHVVERGENFWTISRLYYGSSRYYRALWKANARKYPDIEQIHINDVIEIPAVEELDTAYIDRAHRLPVARQYPTDPDQPDSVPTIRTARTRDDGRTTRQSARSAAPELELPVGNLETNNWTDGVERGVRDGRFGVGSTDSSSAVRRQRTEPTDRPVYKVRRYDTLRSIARDLLGDPRRADEIHDLNREIIADPRRLAAGTLIELPDDADARRVTARDQDRTPD